MEIKFRVAKDDRHKVVLLLKVIEMLSARGNGIGIKEIRCKYCGSPDYVVGYGWYGNIPRYFCKRCKRKFTAEDTLFKMKTPIELIGRALSMYYGGMSLNSVSRHLQQHHSSSLTNAGIYNWIIRFTKDAIKKARDYTPSVGDIWIADETVLRIGGKRIDRLKKGMWFWDIIDAKTRFLLASHISSSRTINDAQTLMEKALERTNKQPQVVITDKLQAYLDGVSTVFGRRTTTHIQTKGFDIQPNTNLIERFHGTLKDRTDVMRGFKNTKSARLILNGWLVHYNFFKPHEALKGKTPAEKAGIKFPYKSWADIVRSSGETTKQQGTEDNNNETYPTVATTRKQRHRTTPKRPKLSKESTPTITEIRTR